MKRLSPSHICLFLRECIYYDLSVYELVNASPLISLSPSKYVKLKKKCEYPLLLKGFKCEFVTARRGDFSFFFFFCRAWRQVHVTINAVMSVPLGGATGNDTGLVKDALNELNIRASLLSSNDSNYVTRLDVLACGKRNSEA